MSVSAQIRIRRDTAANFTSANPTLALGEIAFETDTRNFKVGDGVTAWTSLAYATNYRGNAAAPTSNTVIGSGAGAALQSGGTNNVLIGFGAGDAITTGDECVAVGWEALGAAQTSSNNTAIGARCARLTTGQSNTAIGYAALESNVNGEGSVAVGLSAMRYFAPSTASSNNTAVGTSALNVLTTGVNNTAVGTSACSSMTTASGATGVGTFALLRNLANDVVAVGSEALDINTLGTANVAVGRSALGAATTSAATVSITTAGSGGPAGPTTYTGVQLTYVSGATAVTYPTADITVTSGAVSAITIVTGGTGFTATSGTVMTAASASIGNTTGFTCTLATVNSATNNTAVGHQAGLSLTNGGNQGGIGNAFFGSSSGSSSTTQRNSAFFGHQSGQLATTGGGNVCVGSWAGRGLTSGSGNTIIGGAACGNSANALTGNNNVVIGGNDIYSGFGPATNLTSGYQNVIIGYASATAAGSDFNSVVISGGPSTGNGSNTTTIGNSSTAGTFIPAGNLTLSNGNLILGTSGKGIDFSATANSSGTMTNELLDDYEAGSWTPVLSDGTNNATMSGNNQGRYTKVGNMVTVWGYVETTSLGSVSGNLRITGLPFTVESLNIAYAAGNTVALGAGLAITQYSAVSIRAHPNQTFCVPNVWDATTGTTVMQDTEWTADGSITFSFSYRAA